MTQYLVAAVAAPPVIRILKYGANDYQQIITVIIFHNFIQCAAHYCCNENYFYQQTIRPLLTVGYLICNSVMCKLSVDKNCGNDIQHSMCKLEYIIFPLGGCSQFLTHWEGGGGMNLAGIIIILYATPILITLSFSSCHLLYWCVDVCLIDIVTMLPTNTATNA